MEELKWPCWENGEIQGLLREAGIENVLVSLGALLDQKMAKSKGKAITAIEMEKTLYQGNGRINVRPGNHKGSCTLTMVVAGTLWEELKQNLLKALLDISLLCRRNDGSLTHHFLFVVGTEWRIGEAAEEIEPYLEVLTSLRIYCLIFLRVAGTWKVLKY
jgi:hypothetical protein